MTAVRPERASDPSPVKLRRLHGLQSELSDDLLPVPDFPDVIRNSKLHVLLPQQLRTAGGLEKNVTFVGTGTRAELWDEETYELHKQKISKERISSIAANLLANGFQI